MSDDISTFLDMKALQAENARLRAALNEIYTALEDPEDSYPRNAFAIASKALRCTKPTDISSSEETS